MRKKLIVLLAAVSCVALSFGLIACNNKTEEPPVHQHAYADGWNSSAEGHWHPVTCGHEDAIEIEDHEFSGGVCTVCNYAAMDAFYYEQTQSGYKITGLKDMSVKRISIPRTVTEIAADAFKGCQIERVDINELADWFKIEFGSDRANPLFFGAGLYAGGTLVEDLVIPSGVTKINRYAFNSYEKLNTLTVSDSVLTIDEYAFYDCNNMLRLELGSGLTTLAGTAFQGCRRLIEVCNGSSLDLSNYSFLDDVLAVYPTKSQPTALKKTEDGFVFYSKSSDLYLVKYDGEATNLVLPNSYNGNSYAVRQYAFYYCKSITSVDIGNGVTVIGNAAFYNCTSMQAVTVGENVVEIGSNAFEYCTKLGTVYNNSALNIVKGSNDNGKIAFYAQLVFTNSTLDGYDYLTSLGDYEFGVIDGKYYLTRYSGNATELTLPGNINGNNYEIASSAFYAIDAKLKKVIISDGVTAIGDSAFYEQAELSQIVLGNHVKTIGDYAFYGTAITEITIPDSVELIAGGAFYNLSIDSYTAYEGDVVYLGSNANPHLMAYYYSPSQTAVDTATLHSNTKSIASMAFYNCNATVVISDGVEDIGAYAFYNYNATSITIGRNVKRIGDRAFYNCKNIESVYAADINDWLNITFEANSSNPLWYSGINTNLYVGGKLFEDLKIDGGFTQVKPYAFYRCASLKTVDIGGDVTEIGKSAFEDCYAVTSIKIGNSVRTIADKAFSCGTAKTSACETLILGNSIEYIGETAFSRLSITELVLPDSLKTIGYGAFMSCSNLASVTVGSGLESMDTNVFYSCKNLTSATFKSTTGWQRCKSAEFTDGVEDVSSESLSDASNAATILKGASYYWRRNA